MSTPIHPPRGGAWLKRNKSALKKSYRCVDLHTGRHLRKHARRVLRANARLAADLEGAS